MQQATISSRRKTLRIVLIVLLATLLLVAAVGGLWLVKTLDTNSRLLPACLFHSFTGLYCTGCGVTRALHLILNGHIWAGFRMNPLAITSLPFLAWVTLLVLYRAVMRKPMPHIPTWLPWVALALIVVYTVARNLPWEPFVWLAPTVVP